MKENGSPTYNMQKIKDKRSKKIKDKR